MVEEIPLPLNTALFCKPGFEAGNHFGHWLRTGEAKQAMKVVWHRQCQMTNHLTTGFADGEGFRNCVPYFGHGELVDVAWDAADRDEIDLAFPAYRIHR